MVRRGYIQKLGAFCWVVERRLLGRACKMPRSDDEPIGSCMHAQEGATETPQKRDPLRGATVSRHLTDSGAARLKELCMARAMQKYAPPTVDTHTHTHTHTRAVRGSALDARGAERPCGDDECRIISRPVGHFPI